MSSYQEVIVQALRERLLQVLWPQAFIEWLEHQDGSDEFGGIPDTK